MEERMPEIAIRKLTQPPFEPPLSLKFKRRGVGDEFSNEACMQDGIIIVRSVRLFLRGPFLQKRKDLVVTMALSFFQGAGFL